MIKCTKIKLKGQMHLLFAQLKQYRDGTYRPRADRRYRRGVKEQIEVQVDKLSE